MSYLFNRFCNTLMAYVTVTRDRQGLKLDNIFNRHFDLY